MTTAPQDCLRVAAIGDLHCTRKSRGALQPIFAEIGKRADVLVLCGDLTDYGLPEEATVLAAELSVLSIPVVAVLGNHDHESGHPDQVVDILSDAGVQILDGTSVEIGGVGFAGTKGFGGGFGERALEPWGESAIKNFVREAIDESLKLESGLARLRTRQKIAVLHYSPIQATVEGEPPAIFPFLGSSRLEEPINRYSLTAAVHGHAHHGSPEGRTRSGVPVYNVAMPLLRTTFQDRSPFRLFELPVTPPEPSELAEAEAGVAKTPVRAERLNPPGGP